MLNVREIERGLVIDHIEAGLGERIMNELHLNRKGYNVALLMNAISKKKKSKDIIKIDNISLDDIDLRIIGLIDPNVTINVIENGANKEKVRLTLPEMVKGIFKCRNPRCITTTEAVTPVFHLVNTEEREYRCEFCDTKVTMSASGASKKSADSFE